MITLLALLTAAQADTPSCQEPITPDAPLEVIPAQQLPALLQSRQGCVVLVELYASWCGPCTKLDPALSALVDKHRASGLVPLGLSVDTSAERLQKWREQHGREFVPRLLSDWTLAGLQEDFAAIGAEFSEAIPFLVLVDRQGKAVLALSEPKDLDALDAAITAALEPAAP